MKKFLLTFIFISFFASVIAQNNYYLIVHSFINESKAYSVSEDLKASGFVNSGYMYSNAVNRYRVYLNKYESKADAQRDRSVYIGHFPGAWIWSPYIIRPPRQSYTNSDIKKLNERLDSLIFELKIAQFYIDGLEYIVYGDLMYKYEKLYKEVEALKINQEKISDRLDLIIKLFQDYNKKITKGNSTGQEEPDKPEEGDPPPPPSNILTVINGSGSGDYPPNKEIPVRANKIPNQKFTKWSGDVMTLADTLNPNTTFKMGENNAEIEANYTPIAYNLTVINGSGSGDYPPGEDVTVSAYEVQDKKFAEWTGDIENLYHPLKPSTVFHMGKSDASIEAKSDPIIPYPKTSYSFGIIQTHILSNFEPFIFQYFDSNEISVDETYYGVHLGGEHHFSPKWSAGIDIQSYFYSKDFYVFPSLNIKSTNQIGNRFSVNPFFAIATDVFWPNFGNIKGFKYIIYSPGLEFELKLGQSKKVSLFLNNRYHFATFIDGNDYILTEGRYLNLAFGVRLNRFRLNKDN